METGRAWALVIVVCAVAACLVGPAAAGPALQRADGVESGRLANGVRYVVVEREVSRGAVWLTIDAGSMDEPAGQNGVADLVMRLSLRAPAHFEPGEVERLFRPTDVVLGRSRHGVTTYDRTMFTLGLAGRGAGLDEALLFCSDVLGTPAWDEATGERERAAMVERVRLMDRTMVRVQDELLGRIAPGCGAVGHWPGGTAGALESLRHEDVQSFQRAWYTPGNAAVVVVSAEPAAAVVRRLVEVLGRIPGRAAADRARPTPELDAAPGVTIVVDEGLSRAAAGVVRLTAPGGPIETEADLRAKLRDEAVAGALSRTLERSMRDRSLAGATAEASVQDIFGSIRITQAGADGPGEDALAMVRGVHRAVTGAVTGGTDPVAQQAAWRRVRDSYEERARTRDASDVAWWFADRAFKGDGLAGPEEYVRSAGRLAQEVPTEEFDGRMRELFSGAGLMTVVQSPVRVDQGAVRRAIEEGRSVLEPIEFPLADARGVFEPAERRGVVDELSRHAPTGVTMAWLSGGVRVAHRASDARPGRVHVRLTLAGGVLEETELTRGLTAASVGALKALAVRGVPSAALSRALDERGITLDAGADVDCLYLSLEAPAGALGEVLGVARSVLLGAVAEPGAIGAWRDRFELGRARNEREAYRELADEVRRAWLPGEARLMPLTRARADAITAEAVQGWIDRHASAPAAVSIVGDVSWHEALDAAAAAMGGLAERSRIGRGSLDSVRGVTGPVSSVRREVTLGRAEGAAGVAWGFGAPALDEIDSVRAIVAGSWVLSERLKAELVGPGGDADGGALAAWAGYREDNAFDLFARVEAVIVTDPERVDEMIARAEAIAIGLAADGPTPVELEAFKERADELVQRSLEDHGYLAGVLTTADLRGRSLDDLATAGEGYRSLTAREIRDAVREALTQRPRLSVIVRPGHRGE